MINLNELKEGNRICVFIRHGEKNINDFLKHFRGYGY